MTTQHMIELILKAEDQASKVVKDNEDKIKKFGDAAKQASQKASQSGQDLANKTKLTNKQYSDLASRLQQVRSNGEKLITVSGAAGAKLIETGQKGSESFKKLSKSEQDSLIKFNMLDKETQNLLSNLSKVNGGVPGLSGAITNAKNKFVQLDQYTKTWKGSLDYSRSKLQLLGTDTDSLKGKIKVAGEGIKTYVGDKWDSVKPKIVSVGSTIKSNISGALSTVKSKIESIGQSFSGLGGIITSAMGAFGMNSFKEMTLDLAMGRERMVALTSATLGSADAADRLIEGYDGFIGLNKMTDQSVVSLDQLGQAMNTIKMSTGMTNEQLEKFAPTVNDIGQRAIYMGKSGEEAISLMQAAGRGLNGEFDMLKSNFGISKEKLMELGWSGAADDVEGYTEALDKALEAGGSMDGLMDTTTGKIARLQGNIRIAGRSIGNEMMPYLDQALDTLIKFSDPDSDFPLAQWAIGAVGALSGFATIAPTIVPVLQCMDSLGGKAKSVWNFAGKVKDKLGSLDGSKIDSIKDKFSMLKDKISSASSTAGGFASKIKGFAVAKITALRDAFSGLADKITLAAIKEKLYAAYQWLVNAATAVWNALLNANPVAIIVVAIVALVAALWYLYNTNETVRNAIDGLWQALQQVGAWLMDTLMAALSAVWPLLQQVGSWLMDKFMNGLMVLWQALQPIGEYLMSIFVPIWQRIVMVFNIVWNTIGQVINIFSQFLSGQISFTEMITMIWNTLSAMFVSVFGIIISAVRQFASTLLTKAVETGRGFVNGIINWICQLPGRVLNYLVILKNYILYKFIEFVQTARQKASEMVTGVISFISQLPGKIYQEFINIGARILQAGSDLVNKAKEIGKKIVDGLLNAMGIHSPGTIQTKVVREFKDMVGGVAEFVKPALDVARTLGEGIVESFGNPSLSVDTDNFLNEDAMKTAIGVQESLINDLDSPTMNVGVDTSSIGSVQDGNNQIAGSYDNLATTTGNALNNMVLKDRMSYDTIRNNDAVQLAAMSANLQKNMSNMTSNVHTSLDSMVNKNKTALLSAKNTTQIQLNAMVDKTKIANAKMIESWRVMQNGIINAARKIQTDSKVHFDRLSSTIGTFYGKLRNPARWGAGPGNGRSSGITRRIGSSSAHGNGFKRFGKSIKSLLTPQYLTVQQVKENPLIDSGSFGDFIIRGKNNKYDLSQLIKFGALTIPIGRGAGSWESTAPPNIKHIKDTAGKWSIKSPNIGRYSTNSASFKVKEFETGTPKINFSTFKKLAEEVFAQTEYDFYYDNDKHGNWMNAFNLGLMNCYHGSQAIIALAKAMGLPGSLVHGHWNQYGHFWANIAGHKMDVTGWQNQRNWTPAASHAGPAPKAPSFGDLIDAITSQNNESEIIVETESTSNELHVDGELTVVHDFLNLPEGITAEEVAKLIDETTVSDSFIKKLVSSKLFQKLDLKQKATIERKNNRAIGA